MVKEKEFTGLRDELSLQRQAMPWIKVDKEYHFTGVNGHETLSDLFADKSQLIVYHFMYGPDWGERGCKSCSFWADNFNGIDVHLANRDATLLAVSRAPLAKIEQFKAKMGWNFKWVSSYGSDFNYDYHVSFTEESVANGTAVYNYKSHDNTGESPGISVFYKDEDGIIYHTYSTYARGLDMLNGAYHYMDLLPKGRDESNLPWSMAWLDYHDSYAD
ncbi:MAG: DUF899 domain-containing protein [Anaerolineaceae bacterium]|nr:DUF899 domain-containing protein [Anaerolineaceae bacterium]